MGRTKAVSEIDQAIASINEKIGSLLTAREHLIEIKERRPDPLKSVEGAPTPTKRSHKKKSGATPTPPAPETPRSDSLI